MKTRFHLMVPLLAITLGGCSYSGLKINTDSFDHYQLNPERALYCQGFDKDNSRGSCTSLLIAISFIPETAPIENIYAEKISGPNRTKSLINIMTRGENVQYAVEKLDNGYYRLGKHPQTKTVWDTVKKMHDSLTAN